MAVDASWCTPDGTWLVDSIVDEPGVRYRIWYEGELAGEVSGRLTELDAWLADHGVEVSELVAVPDGWDPFCE